MEQLKKSAERRTQLVLNADPKNPSIQLYGGNKTQASSYAADETTGSIIAGIIKKKIFKGMDPYDTIKRARIQPK